jgi:intein/homing endonuclease
VASRHEQTGQTAPRRILRKWVHDEQPTLLLRLSNGEEIETTSVHRFFVTEKGFLAAGSIEPGFHLTTRTDEAVRVARVDHQVRTAVVYNLSVENYHTYFVGRAGVWVHNQKKIEDSPDDQRDGE